MTLSSQDPWACFEALISPHHSRWQTIDLRVFAVRAGEKLANLVTHAILRFPDEPLAPPLTTDVSERFVAIRRHEPAAALGALLAQLKAGSVKLDRLSVDYWTDPKRSPMFFLSRVRRGERLGFDHLASGGRPLFALMGSGPSFTELGVEARLQDAIWELRAAAMPYESVQDFQVDFLGLRPYQGEGFGDGSKFSVTAPLGLHLDDESKIVGDEIFARVVIMSGPPTDQVRVGIVASTSEGVVRDSRILGSDGSDAWRPIEGGFVATVVWKVPHTRHATLMLNVGAENVDVLTITDPASRSANARLVTHALIDRDLRELGRLLRGGGKQDAHDFETAVGLMLHLCGFTVAQYGSGGPFRDGPDLIAFTHDRSLLMVVECTLREIDAGSKLSKLHARRQRLTVALPNHDVFAVIFSPLTHAEIADHEKAKALGIAVASAETIERLLDLAAQGATTRGVLHQLGLEVS